MRLTLYETDGNSFKILFKEKIMAGLAGYIENGVLSREGMEIAGNGLISFRETVELLNIESIAVFATASLRNIVNTDEAIAEIERKSGYRVEVISGSEEAKLGYIGAMRQLNVTDGAFIDIGGASTEIAVFKNREFVTAASYPIGSLSLYKQCVKKILPGEGSLKRINAAIKKNIDDKILSEYDRETLLVGVGGTARAALKLAKKLFSLPDDCRTVTAEQLNIICGILFKADKTAADLILKLEPDRIHTIIPGLAVLQHITKLFGAEKIDVSSYGVREGFLCRKIMRQN